MTTKPASPPPAAAVAAAIAIAPPKLKPRLTSLPDPPPLPDMASQLIHITDAHGILRDRYYLRPDVLVCGECYLCYDDSDIRGSPRPDCMVAFGLTTITPAEIIDANGYIISEVGKPPEFVLEVASESTGRRDYTEKRVIYAGLKVVEYWRFDRTGGRFHDAPLAGDRLTADGTYEPIPVYEHPDGTFRGYSAVLGLELHWVEGWLRFWDPIAEEYLPDLTESKARTAAAEAERDAAQAERDAAQAARDAAEAERAAEAAARQRAEAERNAEAAARRQLEAQLQQLQAQRQPPSHPNSP